MDDQSKPLSDKELQDEAPKVLHKLKLVARANVMFECLRKAGTERDTAGNRRLLYSHYASLVLLSMFNPMMQSLRGMQQASALKRVQEQLGVGKTSVGSLSESCRVFDPELLVPLIEQLLAELPARQSGPGPQRTIPDLIPRELAERLVAVDGSTFPIVGRCDVGGDNQTLGGVALLSVTNAGSVSAGNVHVFGSGTLTGNAVISATNGTTVDGTLAPNGAGGTFNFGGGLQLNGGATTQCKVTPQDPSTTPQVSVSAQVSLGGRLSVTMTGDFSSAPTRFTLLYANSVDSSHRTFASQSITYPTGQGCWVPQITYDYTGGHVSVYLDRVINCN